MIKILCENKKEFIFLRSIDDVTLGANVSINGNRALCISDNPIIKYFLMLGGKNNRRRLGVPRYSGYEIENGEIIFN